MYTTCIIMMTAMSVELKAGKNISSMYSVIQRSESINLTPECTVPTIELVDIVFPLLDASEGMVQSIYLYQTGITVAALKILSRLPSYGQIRNLGANLKCDSLADEYYGHGVLHGLILQLLLKRYEKYRSLRGGGCRVRDRKSNRSSVGVFNMMKNTDAIKDSFNGELPGNVTGTIQHHIRVLEVSMTNLLYHSTEPISIHNMI